MKETDCRKCCVCAFKEDLCNGDFCEKYYREGNTEDFEKLLPHWIPILDGDGQMPEVDDEGYSDYILLSFRNATFLCIGQYRVDEEGGAFYDGDSEDPLTKIGLFVNAWMPLPERYHDPL